MKTYLEDATIKTGGKKGNQMRRAAEIRSSNYSKWCVLLHD